MKFKKTLIAAALTLPMLSMPAYAGLLVDNWTIDTNGVTGQGLTQVVNGIDEITFTAITHATSPTGIYSGASFNTTGLGVATAFNSFETGIIGGHSLNLVGGWELTFDWTAGGHFTTVSATDASFTHDTPGVINFYIDNLADAFGVKANPLTGAGYTDGTKFASFTVMSGLGGVLHLVTGDGSDDAMWLIDLANTLSGVLFDSSMPAKDLGINYTTTMSTDSNFDANPNPSNPIFSLQAGGFACGKVATDFCAKEDGSTVLLVPEPASLALLGLGLAGIALGRRRSKNA